jgi:threonine/homoserine/homoserine lactone efflux protein
MIALFAGTLLGLIISIPVGPINLTVLTKGMRDGFKPAFWTGVGSATMEFIYCLLAMFGMSALLLNIRLVVYLFKLSPLRYLFILGSEI